MDKSRLEQLLKQHHKDAFIWARQCSNYNYDNACDVLQLTYLKILEGKAKYQGKANFKTWLFSVIRFTAFDYLKDNISYNGLEQLEMVEEEDIEPDPINYKALLAQLSDRQHQILLLAFYHGLTLEQISTITDLHIGTVRTHYERGKSSLKNILIKLKV